MCRLLCSCLQLPGDIVAQTLPEVAFVMLVLVVGFVLNAGIRFLFSLVLGASSQCLFAPRPASCAALSVCCADGLRAARGLVCLFALPSDLLHILDPSC